jgi:quinol monooxygenase YgiN
VPREDDTKLLVYEVYRDDAAFDEHLNAVSIARFRKETDGMFEKIYATRCTPAE